MVIQKYVQTLLDGGIKLLALDFDLTICSAHTHGRYLGTAEDLHMYVLSVVFIVSEKLTINL